MKMIEINVETQEVIERDLTAEELAIKTMADKDIAERENKKIEAEQNRTALLEKLGITEDEAKLLLS